MHKCIHAVIECSAAGAGAAAAVFFLNLEEFEKCCERESFNSDAGASAIIFLVKNCRLQFCRRYGLYVSRWFIFSPKVVVVILLHWT